MGKLREDWSPGGLWSRLCERMGLVFYSWGWWWQEANETEYPVLHVGCGARWAGMLGNPVS